MTTSKTVIKTVYSPGEYWIGDLCYVLHEVWDEVCDLTFDKEGNPIDGDFILKDGRYFSHYKTKYWDGVYLDNNGQDYPVDSGAIGMILVSDIDESDSSNDIVPGQIHTFEREFVTWSDKPGVMVFGDVRIDTGYEDEDED